MSNEKLLETEAKILDFFNTIKKVQLVRVMTSFPGDLDSGKFHAEFLVATDKGLVTVIFPGESPWL